MRTGKVKFFNTKNKFGFIVEDKTGKEFYVHIKDLLDPIEEGNVVEFETEPRKRGEIAVRVRKKN